MRPCHPYRACGLRRPSFDAFVGNHGFGVISRPAEERRLGRRLYAQTFGRVRITTKLETCSPIFFRSERLKPNFRSSGFSRILPATTEPSTPSVFQQSDAEAASSRFAERMADLPTFCQRLSPVSPSELFGPLNSATPPPTKPIPLEQRHVSRFRAVTRFFCALLLQRRNVRRRG